MASLFDDGPARLREKTAGLFALLVAMNVAAWGWALLAFSSRPALLGAALLAYLSRFLSRCSEPSTISA